MGRDNTIIHVTFSAVERGRGLVGVACRFSSMGTKCLVSCVLVFVAGLPQGSESVKGEKGECGACPGGPSGRTVVLPWLGTPVDIHAPGKSKIKGFCGSRLLCVYPWDTLD